MIIHIANRPHLLLGSMCAIFFGCVFAFSAIEHFSIGDSLYWGVTTSVTVGYGDLSPKTGWGKLDACILMVSMVFFFLNLVAGVILGKIVEDKNVFTSEEQEQMKQALAFLVNHVDRLDGIDDLPEIKPDLSNIGESN